MQLRFINAFRISCATCLLLGCCNGQSDASKTTNSKDLTAHLSWRQTKLAKVIANEYLVAKDGARRPFSDGTTFSIKMAKTDNTDSKMEPSTLGKILWASHLSEKIRRNRRDAPSHESLQANPAPDEHDDDHLHYHGVHRDKHAHNAIPKVASGPPLSVKDESKTAISINPKPVTKTEHVAHAEDINKNVVDPEDKFPNPRPRTEAGISAGQKFNESSFNADKQSPGTLELRSQLTKSAATKTPELSLYNFTLSNRVERRPPARKVEPENIVEKQETKRSHLPDIEVEVESMYRDELLSVKIDGDEHEVKVLWTYPHLPESGPRDDSTPYYTGFRVTYKVVQEDGDESEEYDSSKLGHRVRSFLLHSLHTDKEYIICVHVMVNTTSVQKSCANWSLSSLKVLVGILAGTIFLIPCLIGLFWILHKDKKMKQKANYGVTNDERAVTESLIRPKADEIPQHHHHHKVQVPHDHGDCYLQVHANGKPGVLHNHLNHRDENNRQQSSKSIFPSHFPGFEQPGNNHTEITADEHNIPPVDTNQVTGHHNTTHPFPKLSNGIHQNGPAAEVTISKAQPSKKHIKATMPLREPLVNQRNGGPKQLPVVEKSRTADKARKSDDFQTCHI